MLNRTRAVASLAAAAGFFFGCSAPKETGERRVTAAALDSLPQLDALDGPLVCIADGARNCPVDRAIANWIGRSAFALWEPSRVAELYVAGDSAGRALGSRGPGEGQYAFVLAVGPVGEEVSLIDGSRSMLLRFTREGSFVRESPISRPTFTFAPGYSGSIPLVQALTAASPDVPARLTVRVLPNPALTEGVEVLDVAVPWLRLRDGAQDGPTPFFSTFPIYALDRDRSVVWSPADSFVVQRRASDGAVAWTLTSDRAGPPVTPDELAKERRRVIDGAPVGLTVAKETLDTMVALTAKRHAAIGGLLLDPDGGILVAGSTTGSPMRVDYVRLESDGTPQSRFELPASTRPLLFGGDSILVHRPTETEFREVRWLYLRR